MTNYEVQLTHPESKITKYSLKERSVNIFWQKQEWICQVIRHSVFGMMSRQFCHVQTNVAQEIPVGDVECTNVWSLMAKFCYVFTKLKFRLNMFFFLANSI